MIHISSKTAAILAAFTAVSAPLMLARPSVQNSDWSHRQNILFETLGFSLSDLICMKPWLIAGI